VQNVPAQVTDSNSRHTIGQVEQVVISSFDPTVPKPTQFTVEGKFLKKIKEFQHYGTADKTTQSSLFCNNLSVRQTSKGLGT